MSAQNQLILFSLVVFGVYWSTYFFFRFFKQARRHLHALLVVVNLTIATYIILYFQPKALALTHWNQQIINILTAVMLLSAVVHHISLITNFKKKHNLQKLLHFQISHLGYFLPFLISSIAIATFLRNTAVTSFDNQIANLYAWVTIPAGVAGSLIGLKIIKLPYK